jgi:hypothetical protein
MVPPMTNTRHTTTPGLLPGVTWTRRTMAALLMLAGLLAAGCGGGGGAGDDVASVSDDDAEEASAEEEDPDAELLDWVECMRDEGIDMSDPVRDADGNLQIDGPGIHIGGGPAGDGGFDAPPEKPDEGEEPDIDPEAMAAATETCGPPPMGEAGDMSEEDRQVMEANALEFAECMRDEGIEDFPDPDFSESGPGGAPETNSDGAMPGDDPGGEPQTRVMVGPFGEIDMDDPATKAAFEACQDLIALPGAEGPGGADAGEGSGT